MHFVSCGGAFTHFSCKLGLKFFFSALGGAGAPTAPPGYAYAETQPNFAYVLGIQPDLEMVVQNVGPVPIKMSAS